MWDTSCEGKERQTKKVLAPTPKVYIGPSFHLPSSHLSSSARSIKSPSFAHYPLFRALNSLSAMYFTKATILFFSFAVSVSALTTPHVPRGVHHRALAGRVAVPTPVSAPAIPLRSRQNGKRCKPRPSSSQASPAAETTKAAPATHAAQVVPETTKEATHKPSPTPEPVTTKEQPPPPTTTKKSAPPPPSKPAPPPAGNLPSFMTGTQTGQGTFYASMCSHALKYPHFFSTTAF